jgi:ABC-type branched-subunit amino acid transport system substrate-binding protein
MNRKILLVTLLTMAVALNIGAGSSLAKTKTPGVTDTQILIGSSAGLSGPIANWGNNLSRFAPQAVFNMANERGGINGRLVKYIVYDDGYKPDRAMANVKKLIERDHIFAMLLQMGTPTNMATYKYVTEVKKVPLMYPATGAHIWGFPFKKRIFTIGVDYWMGAYTTIDYLIFTRDIKKIGIFFQDDDYGYDVRNPAVDRLKQHGLKPVGEEKYKSGQVDVSAQVTKLRQASAEGVVLGTVYISGSQFLREAKKMGWKVQAIGIPPTGLQKMIDLSGDAAPGFVNMMTNPDAEFGQGPAMDQYRRVIHKYYPNAPFDNTTLYGWIAGTLFVEILKRAGRDLTRDGLIAAGETLKNFETGIIAPITYSNTKHYGSSAHYPVVVRDIGGGKLRFVPIAPDMDEKQQRATPQYVDSWDKTPEEAKPAFLALRKYPQR